VIVHPADGLAGTVRVPGDKSVTHRAVMLASIATGVTEITNAGTGADNRSTMSAMAALGVPVHHDTADQVTVEGVGLRGLAAPDAPIDCGNSGTTTRLLAGLLAGANVEAELIGDASLSSRPMRRVSDPLGDLGYVVHTSDAGTLPMRVTGAPRTGDDIAVRAVLKTASAQVKSCILLSGLYRDTMTEVVEPAVSRDHTERMLRALGVRVESSAHYMDPRRSSEFETAPTVRLHAPERLVARPFEVPGDPSTAAFVVAAAALAGASVTIENVGTNPTRAAWLDVMKRMGVGASLRRRRMLTTGEPAADLAVRPGALTATTIRGGEVPLVIDEIPILCVLGAASTGRFEVHDARELRVKESDRIAETARILEALGCTVEVRDDGLSFDGLGEAAWDGFECSPADDHRIALSGIVAALAARTPSRIHDAECVAVSWPECVETFAALGARFDEVPDRMQPVGTIG